MKFILIIVWFALPQQQYADSSNAPQRQPLGVLTQEFEDFYACEAQAKRIASPYIDATCVRATPTPVFYPWGVGEICC